MNKPKGYGGGDKGSRGPREENCRVESARQLYLTTTPKKHGRDGGMDVYSLF